MAANRTIYWLSAAALALAARSAVAQIDEADRLARCQNNRDALARLEATRASYATEEQIASARTALVSIRRIETEINSNVNEIEDIRRNIDVARTPEDPQEYSSDASQKHPFSPGYVAYAEGTRNRLIEANLVLNERIIAWGASVNFHCPGDEPACSLTLPQRLASGIDAAVAQQPQYRQFLREVAAHNSNLIALRCEQPDSADGRTIASDSAGVPNFAGTWADIDNRLFYISQSGDQVTMTINIFGKDEKAEGTFSGGLLNMRWMAGNPPRMQQGSGTVTAGADGVAREIRFPNGFHYVRQ